MFAEDTPSVSITVDSDIPVRAGLGSSAAATVAGLLVYQSVTRARPVADWLRLASDIEGHPDNAAAALLGGLSLSCQYDDGRVDAWSWEWPPAVRFVVATPAVELETAFARTVLPSEISRADAVFNLQRALLFVRALETGEYRRLREALRDRWHQPYRQKFVPALAEALALDHDAVFGVCLSGSGPSVALLTDDRTDEAAKALGAIYQRLGVPYRMRTLTAHPPGPRQERS
jgi:homoserine kinase